MCVTLIFFLKKIKKPTTKGRKMNSNFQPHKSLAEYIKKFEASNPDPTKLCSPKLESLMLFIQVRQRPFLESHLLAVGTRSGLAIELENIFILPSFKNALNNVLLNILLEILLQGISKYSVLLVLVYSQSITGITPFPFSKIKLFFRLFLSFLCSKEVSLKIFLTSIFKNSLTLKNG